MADDDRVNNGDTYSTDDDTTDVQFHPDHPSEQARGGGCPDTTQQAQVERSLARNSARWCVGVVVWRCSCGGGSCTSSDRRHRAHSHPSHRPTRPPEKANELTRELAVMKLTHERKVDQKDAAVDRRDADLDEAEHQFQSALESHLLNIDNLIAVQTARMEAAQKQFDSELSTLETEFNDEK